MTPEAKAAEEIARASPEYEAGPEAGVTEKIIASANEGYFLPLLREVFDFCRFHGIKCDNVVSEIARLESAAKEK